MGAETSSPSSPSLSSTPPAPDASFLRGGGELGRLIHAFDWSTTSLGPMADWPQSLKTVTSLLLYSPVPIVLLWGEDGVMIYNDAYSVFAGGRHPRLLGSRVREGWPEVADFNDHVMKVGLAGGTLAYKDQELTLHRHGRPEQVWMNLDYSPVLDESGRPAGVIAIVVETSDRVRAERRIKAERERLAQLFEQAPGLMALMRGPDHVFEFVNRSYLRFIGGRDVLGKPIRDALPEMAGQGVVALLDRAYKAGEAVVASSVSVLLQRDEDAEGEEHIVDFVFQPITDASGAVTGLFVEGADVTERRRMERHLRLVANELNHRVKNNLAMTQALAVQSFRNASDINEAQASLVGRIMALAQANDLLTGERWVGASLGGIIEQAVRPQAPGGEGRLVIGGPEAHLTPKTALSLSMAVHELATNALKYGAWSTPAGRVTIAWTRSATGPGGAERLRLEWRESGGPPVTAPSRRGFGSRLIERGLAAEMGGTVDMLFQPDGLVCVIDAPLSPGIGGQA